MRRTGRSDAPETVTLCECGMTIRAICAQVYEHYRRARGARGDGLSESATNRPHRMDDRRRGCTGILYVKTVNSSGAENWKEHVGGVIMYVLVVLSVLVQNTALRIPRAPHLKLTHACNQLCMQNFVSYEPRVVLSSTLCCASCQSVIFFVPWMQSRK